MIKDHLSPVEFVIQVDMTQREKSKYRTQRWWRWRHGEKKVTRSRMYSKGVQQSQKLGEK